MILHGLSWQRIVTVVVALNAFIATTLADHSPSQSAQRIRVRTGFEVSLAAQEPEIVDPVSAAWGIDGTLWVVEMPDYPLRKPGQIDSRGRIRVLAGRDSNGHFRSCHTFADGLDFATGVLPWRDGAIVTLAGQIVFLRDQDRDGRADSREVWFEGFTIDNEQLRANHPTLGPDGWVYVAGGLRGGEITAVDARFDKKSKPLKLRNRDFAFHPHGGSWTAVSGNSQHGLTIDDFNRRLGCSNRNPAMAPMISAGIIDEDSFLTPEDAIVDVAKFGFQSQVHSIADAWTTSTLHAGQFSAACGILAPGWKMDGPSQSVASEWLLVCEPTASAVQRQRLTLLDGVWNSEREAEASEWLASEDDWFRAVDLVPDFGGGVLVVDMVRAVIEHPHWAPPELKNRSDTYDGNDLGRIWQVHAAGNPIAVHAINSDADAINAIVSDDVLRRSLASLYWISRYTTDELPDDGILQSLAEMMGSIDIGPASQARVAWILNGWGKLGADRQQLLLGASDPRLRALAIGLRVGNDPNEKIVLSPQSLIAAFDDPAIIVRRAALESLIASADRFKFDPETIASLAALAKRDRDDRWMTSLLMALPLEYVKPLLVAELTAAPIPARDFFATEVLEGWMRRVASRDEASATAILTRWLDQSSADPESNESMLQIDRITQSTIMKVATAWKQAAGNARRFQRIDTLAIAIALDREHSNQTRLAAIAWLADFPDDLSPLRSLVNQDDAAAIRPAAYRLLLKRDLAWTKQFIVANANSILPADRQAICTAMRGDVETSLWLVTQISEGRLPRNFVDPSSMDWFRNHSNSKLSQLGQKTFSPPGDIAAMLEQYSVATIELEQADVFAGKALFAQHCASCHRIDGVGQSVGPDISDSRDKTPESLLHAILDPSAAIDASFVAYQVLTWDGEAMQGLLVDENAETVTLRLAGGQTRSIDRGEIEVFQLSTESMMPAGMQRVLDVPQMRSLLAYLKRWRYVSISP